MQKKLSGSESPLFAVTIRNPVMKLRRQIKETFSDMLGNV